MQEQIKEIRVQLDGIAQLTKELGNVTKIEGKYIPEGINPDDFIKECKVKGFPKEAITVWMPSKEVNKAYDSLILAKAWLGKVLEELGSETPYKNDGSRKEVKDIEPAADKPGIDSTTFTIWLHKDFIQGEWYNKNHIEKVDWLREEIKNLIENKLLVLNGPPSTTRELAIARTNSYNHLCEARFWLGFELGRIRDESGK